jgi:hypothetical protein
MDITNSSWVEIIVFQTSAAGEPQVSSPYRVVELDLEPEDYYQSP